jgi:hypothetical protein
MYRFAGKWISFIDRPRRDKKVGTRPCVAEKCLTGASLRNGESVASESTHLSGDNVAFAGSAKPLAARKRNFKSCALRRIEH